jgi:SAM-dependent methyltransferase
MALNSTELRVLRDLIVRLATENGRRPRVLLLGYPDLFASDISLKAVGIDLSWDELPKRPLEVSRKIWEDHGRPDLSDHLILDAPALITAFGGDAVVSDAIRWGGEDFVLDLNLAMGRVRSWRLGRFDLIIDPGTTEHCFNVAQAFDNIDRLLAPSGFIYHQAAIAFPNHGFWSISPTTFFDFYQSRGYQLGKPKRWNGGLDAEGFIIKFAELEPFTPITGLPCPIIATFAFRKRPILPPALRHSHPIQRCYSSLSRELELEEFLPGAPVT